MGTVIAVRPFCHTDHYWQVYFDTNKAIADSGRGRLPRRPKRGTSSGIRSGRPARRQPGHAPAPGGELLGGPGRRLSRQGDDRGSSLRAPVRRATRSPARSSRRRRSTHPVERQHEHRPCEFRREPPPCASESVSELRRERRLRAALLQEFGASTWNRALALVARRRGGGHAIRRPRPASGRASAAISRVS